MNGFFEQFRAFNIMFVVMFCLVTIMGIIIFTIVISAFIRFFRHQKKVDRMPQQMAQAKVVAKRTAVWGEHAHTAYYATFEFAGGARTELRMSGEQYGMLAEGDEGTLTYQGDRFIDFQRI